MIPFSLFQAFFITESEQLEVRALELSPTSFSIRLAPMHQRLIPDIQKVQVRFYSPVNNTDLTFDLSDYEVLLQSHLDGENTGLLANHSLCYEVTTQDSQFSECVKALTSEYLTYVDNKMNLFPEELSHTYYPEYPANQEEDFCDNWEEQKKYWVKEVCDMGRLEKVPSMSDGMKVNTSDALINNVNGIHNSHFFISRKFFELGLHVRYSCEIESFIKTTPAIYLKNKFAEYALDSHALATAKLTHISFGDACCPLLFPAPQYYESIIKHSLEHKLKLLFQLAPVSDTLLDSICASLVTLNQLLLDHGCSAEIEVGDMGMLRFCERLKGFSLVSKGVLMCKKKKDPRMSYLSKEEGNVLSPLSSHKDSWLPLDETEQNIYLPYYQTNTGTFCTLRALTDHGSRSKQTRITSCNQECQKQHILYPKHLNMVGIGNSLYSFHVECLEKGYEKLKKRMVINL